MEFNSEVGFVFEAIDYSHTPVVLSRATWQSKAGNSGPGEHPEVRDYLDAVRITIEKPEEGNYGR